MICDKIGGCLDRQILKQPMELCVNSNVECIEVSDNRLYVKCEEKGKKYILENTAKNHVISYKMDGGVIFQDKTVPQGICKCDNMFVINGQECDAILIELKGVDIVHSLKQIDGTLIQFKGFFSRFKHLYGRIVVSSSAPNIRANPDYVKLEKKIRTVYKGNLKISKVQFNEKDTELAQVKK